MTAPARPTALGPVALIGGLLLLTIVLVVWQHYGMVRQLDLVRAAGVQVDARDDRPEGGASQARLLQTPGTLEVDCRLAARYAWPYCGVYFGLGEGAQGMDLSRYDTVTLEMDYAGPPPPSLRLYLHNFEPGLSRVGQWNSQKVNEIEFQLPADGRMTIPLDLLHTATWWITQQQPPLLRTAPQRDNITSIDLYTGSTSQPGAHRMAIRSVRFEGKWVSRSDLLAGLLTLWGASGLVYLVHALLAYRRHLADARTSLAALTGINAALRLDAEELASQAYLDELTGALNRHGLRDLLTRGIRVPHLLDLPCALLLADLDHFKLINDKYGHLDGDAVLRDFVRLVQAQLRGTDRLVRWGGEEFLIVCPGTDAGQALALANALRAAVAAHAWEGGKTLTVSLGVSSMTAADDFSAALARTDAALYRAKQSGRNCVAFERGPVVTEPA